MKYELIKNSNYEINKNTTITHTINGLSVEKDFYKSFETFLIDTHMVDHLIYLFTKSDMKGKKEYNDLIIDPLNIAIKQAEETIKENENGSIENIEYLLSNYKKLLEEVSN